jgi:superfamily II DNA helicase RecQ
MLHAHKNMGEGAVLIKIFCLNFDSAIGGFNDDVLRDFLKDKDILTVNDHFFIRNEIPYLTLIVKYQPHNAENRIGTGKNIEKFGNTANSKQATPEWRAILSDADMALFNSFRDWRSKQCKKDGVPPYVVLTNLQVAKIVKARPQTKAELSVIEGVGSAKSDKYGVEILALSKITT